MKFRDRFVGPHTETILPQQLAEATYRTTVVAGVTLGATCALFANYDHSPSMPTSHHVESNCHESAIEQGESLASSLNNHLDEFPQANTFQVVEMYTSYSLAHEIPINKQLTAHALTICMSPDGSTITSIANSESLVRLPNDDI